MPQQPMNNRFQRRTDVFPNAQPQPFMPPVNVQTFPAQPANVQQPNTQPATTTPANPFGLPAGATTMPGVVTPVPQQPNPNAPPNRRPPPQ
jgi:hypothetical protein